ncbi:MAG: hypothetical protein ABSA44_13800 [Bacteroidota bacterium]
MRNILLLLALFITISANGQTFDFYNKKLIGDTSGVLRNDNFTFTLKNFNSFKYTVVVDNKPINNNLDMPDLFKTYLQKTAPKNGSDTTRGMPNLTEELKTFENLYDSYVKLKTAEQFYYALVALVGSDLSPEEIINYKKEYYKQFMKNDTSDDKSDVARIINYYSDKIINISFYAPIYKTTQKERKEAIDSILKDTKEIESSKIPQKLASLYCEINDQAFTVHSFIPKPNADDLTITVTAKPNSAYNKSSDEIKIDIPFLVNGGWKIDFSTGIFLSNIVDKEYVNKPNYVNDSVVGYNLIQADNNSISYGIAGYMHAYWRTACNFNGGIVLGLGVDQNTQVKIMPGVSLMLGRKERFIINGGMVIGKSKELSNIQDENHLYKVKTDPLYSEPYKIGWFVGISYNLSK